LYVWKTADNFSLSYPPVKLAVGTLLAVFAVVDEDDAAVDAGAGVGATVGAGVLEDGALLAFAGFGFASTGSPKDKLDFMAPPRFTVVGAGAEFTAGFGAGVAAGAGAATGSAFGFGAFGAAGSPNDKLDFIAPPLFTVLAICFLFV
jgi:hypothetical protein